jgi:Ni/Co efflux regulator RcnB
MKRILTTAAAALIAVTGLAGAAVAQPYGHDHDRGYQKQDDRGYQRQDDRGYQRQDDRGHHNWRRGERISRDDWGRYQRVDWRHHHLRRPPRGYEWREVDGNYVLAAAATGLIASIIANSR